MTTNPVPTTQDDGSLAAASDEWLASRGISSVDCHGNYVYDEPEDSDLDDDEPEDEPKDIWAMLEEAAPAGCGAVQDLYSWSLNYDPGKGPFAFFLDAIGWSDDNIGEPVCHPGGSRWGYVELRKLADALTEYVDQPYTVAEYVDALMAAEAR